MPYPLLALLAIGASALVMPGHLVLAAPRSAPIHLRLGHPQVAPGSPQTITVRTRVRAPVRLTVTFPNGSIMVHSGDASASGTLRWTFLQPPSSITRTGRRATVTAITGPSHPGTVAGHYTVGFGPLDVVVPYSGANPGTSVRLWIHTAKRTRVLARIADAGRPNKTVTGTTNAQGWLAIPYRAPTPVGPASTITLSGQAHVRGKAVTGRASFVVRPFQFEVALVDPHLLHQVRGAWTPTTRVAVGETVRFGGHAIGMEPSGRVATCVSGTVRIEGKAARVLKLSCATQAGKPYVSAETRFTSATDIGAHFATIHVAWKSGQATYILPFTVTSR